MRIMARVIVAVVAFILCSCIAPQNSAMVDVDVRKWDRAKSLTYENSDTLSLRNLNIAIRYNKSFKESVLPLKLAIITPDKRVYEETISLQLQRPYSALPISTTESRPYRTNVTLNQKGAYVFAFKPMTDVKGVEAIGIEFK